MTHWITKKLSVFLLLLDWLANPLMSCKVMVVFSNQCYNDEVIVAPRSMQSLQVLLEVSILP